MYPRKTIEDLPKDVLFMIMFMLPTFADNLTCRRVNKRWRVLAKELRLVRSYFQIGNPWKNNETRYFALTNSGNYASLQPNLRPAMRTILVNWMIEVHHEFRLAPKTLFLAIGYLDRLLIIRPAIPRSRFQLFGLTCLWIASKFEDIYTNSIQDLVWICDDAYSRQDFENAEGELLNLFDWNLSQITTVCFLNEQLQNATLDNVFSSAENVSNVYFLAHCLSEISLSEYPFLRTFKPSFIACASLIVSYFEITGLLLSIDWIMKSFEFDPIDDPRLCETSILNSCIRELHNLYRAAHQNVVSGLIGPVFEKYTHVDRGQASLRPPRDDYIVF